MCAWANCPPFYSRYTPDKLASCKVMDEYNVARGWDPATGKPRQSTLKQLDLAKIADELETYGVTVPP